jgi:flagellar basal-body rod modification protein FlgD
MAVTDVTSSSKIQMDYMKLLVTQLQNQNPLDPMDNNQMAAQLTSFSQLQQLETMNTSFASVLKNSERNYAISLIGKEIAFGKQNETTGETEIHGGVVKQIYNTDDGKTMLVTNNNDLVDMDSIMSVQN